MSQVTFSSILPAELLTEAVKVILTDALPDPKFGITEVDVNEVTTAIQKFNHEGPYCMAERLNLLKNNNAEDMAIEFMTFVNKMFPCTY
jgi:ethanolamine utilization protein EutQ (cupin superfamily)